MGALSRGCGTCKRRKVKCDETRPKCTRCSVAGIDCAGYTPRLRFVHEESRIRRQIAVTQAQSHDFATKTSNYNISFHSGRIRSPLPPGSVAVLPASLPLTAFKDDIFISFLVHKFFEPGKLFSLSSMKQSPCGLPREWTNELVDTPQKPRPKSWDALAAIVFGQANRSSDVIRTALSLYCQALSELREQLSHHRNQHSHSTLASITALYIYQILASRAEKSWMLHIDGLGGIWRSQGPWLSKSSFGRSIFLEHRITLVAKAIMSGQRTFLNQPVWKKVPWEDDIRTKLPMDCLVDILAEIANCLADVKIFHGSAQNHDPHWAHLRNQIVICVRDLNTWWCQWEENQPEGVGIASSRQAINSQSFGTLLEYETLTTAYEVCFHNTVRILLLQLCKTFQLFPNQSPDTKSAISLDISNPTVLLGISSDSPGLAREILRSLTYCYGKSRRFIFKFSFLFIQEVAYGCFAKDSEEAIWFTSQDWAGLGTLDNVADANLLRRLLP